MTDNPVTWLVAVWQVLTAAGIAVFWTTWFRQPHVEPWHPPGYVEHERVFFFPDGTLASLLVASAVLLVLEQSPGASLALICAGMLAFLGIIDAAYFAQHGMYARDRGGPVNAFLVIAVLALALVLAIRYA